MKTPMPARWWFAPLLYLIVALVIAAAVMSS